MADIDQSGEQGESGLALQQGESGPALKQGESGPVLDPKVAALCTPFSDTDPCGPDLDMEGDSDYLNFFARVEGVLPTTFFSVEDGSPFDRSTVDLKGQLDALKPLLGRTRDIRLLVVQARLSILNKDLGGFAVNLAATAYWLDKFWDAVHPRVQQGDMVARSSAAGSFDQPTVVFPLQYAPLVEARRLGPISYRTWMIATGEVQPRTGEVQLGQAAISEAISTADPEALAATRKNISLIKTSLDTIRNVFLGNGESAGLDKVAALVAAIRAFIDPQATAAEAPQADAASEGAAAMAAEVGPAPASLAQVSEALAAIGDYYSRSEPSSPILLLVRQAHHLVGKSFFEVMNILIPAHMDKAAFQIGADQFFDLPVEKLSNFAEVPSPPSNGGGEAAEESAPAARRYTVANRSQALALLDQVHQYFRRSEPASPVPMLCERARALAERDFMGVLRDVLPKDALRNINDER